MNLRKLLYLFFIIYFTPLSAQQDYLVEITLLDATMIDECHFGDEWNAYFSLDGRVAYEKYGEKFKLKPQQSFTLYSIITEGNEKYDDYEQKLTDIQYEDIKPGLFQLEIDVYVEDDHKGRYKCNNATFRFDYKIHVTQE